MKNRIKRHIHKSISNVKRVKKFFLACEFKPESNLWSVLEPFSYDITPAFIFGTLGVIATEPEAYSIVEFGRDKDPLVGYSITITNPDAIMLLDKIKGYNGTNAFNYHVKNLVPAYVDSNNFHNAWCYSLNSQILEAYSQIESIELGLWADDDKQLELLEKIGAI